MKKFNELYESLAEQIEIRPVYNFKLSKIIQDYWDKKKDPKTTGNLLFKKLEKESRNLRDRQALEELKPIVDKIRHAEVPGVLDTALKDLYSWADKWQVIIENYPYPKHWTMDKEGNLHKVYSFKPEEIPVASYE